MAKDYVAAYVDTLFTAAETGPQVVRMTSILESALLERRSLAIKDGSRACIVPRGSPHGTSEPACQSRHVVTVLGHTSSSDGSTRHDWQRCRLAMWRSFYRTCSSEAARKLSWDRKHKLLK